MEILVIRRKRRHKRRKNSGLPPHWPQDRSLAAVYVTVVFIGCFNAVPLFEELYEGALRVRRVYGSYGSCDANKSERSQISRV